MSLLKKLTGTVKEVRDKDDFNAWKEQKEADIAYIAMMTGVDIDTDDETVESEE